MLFVILASAVPVHAVRKAIESNNDLLDMLDKRLEQSDNFSRGVLERLEERRRQSASLPDERRLEELAQIGLDYEPIMSDSAIAVYDEGYRLATSTGNKRYITKFSYRRNRALPMMGLVEVGTRNYGAVKAADVDPRDLSDFYDAGFNIYSHAVEYYRVDSLRQRYATLANAMADSTVNHLSATDNQAIYMRAIRRLRGPEASLAAAELAQLMSTLNESDPLYAKSAAAVAMYALANGNQDDAVRYLALSAIADIGAGRMETTSLHRLGQMLYEIEDYDRAYTYLTNALERAVISGSRIRALEISELLPLVVATHHEINRESYQTLIIALIVMGIVLVVALVILVMAIRTRRRLNRLRRALSTKNDLKDTYIRRLITLCGVYLTALEDFSRLAGRKIKVGQTQDLLKMIESGRIVRDQLQHFYDVFDEAFLTVYPDFVEQVNRLFLPDKRIATPDDGHLTTELRILAFMRLGADDSTQLAKFLGLTVNTIYTYRNKIKSRAIDRDNFEKDIRNIGLIN